DRGGRENAVADAGGGAWCLGLDSARISAGDQVQAVRPFSGSQTLFGNGLPETLFRMPKRNRVSRRGFPNRVWEPERELWTPMHCYSGWWPCGPASAPSPCW